MEKWRKKAIRLEEDLETFEMEHPDITIVRNWHGKIKDVQFPSNHDGYFVIFNPFEVLYIDYFSNTREHVTFPS